MMVVRPSLDDNQVFIRTSSVERAEGTRRYLNPNLALVFFNPTLSEVFKHHSHDILSAVKLGINSDVVYAAKHGR